MKIPDRLNATVTGPLASVLEQQMRKAIRESLEDAQRAKVGHNREDHAESDNSNIVNGEGRNGHDIEVKLEQASKWQRTKWPCR